MKEYNEQAQPTTNELDESLEALGYGLNLKDFKTW